jgi:hypothetical protein
MQLRYGVRNKFQYNELVEFLEEAEKVFPLPDIEVCRLMGMNIAAC